MLLFSRSSTIFQNLHALIYLAPISAFDQTLVEDKRVNRLVSERSPVPLLVLVLTSAVPSITGRLASPVQRHLWIQVPQERQHRSVPEQGQAPSMNSQRNR